VHQVPANQQYGRREDKAEDKSRENCVNFLILDVTRNVNTYMGKKRGNGKTTQLFGRRQGGSGVKLHDPEDQDEDGQVWPICDKGLEIDTAPVIVNDVINFDNEKTGAEGQHYGDKIRYDHSGGSECGAGTFVSGPEPKIKVLDGHLLSLYKNPKKYKMRFT